MRIAVNHQNVYEKQGGDDPNQHWPVPESDINIYLATTARRCAKNN